VRERGREGLALIVAASRTPFGAERDRHEHRLSGWSLDQLGHDRGHVVPDAREPIVFQGMDSAARAAVEPHRRPHRGELAGPGAAQPARTEMRLRLPAAFAPGPAHRSPTQPTDAADEVVAELRTEEPVAHQTLGGQEQLLEGVGDSLEIHEWIRARYRE
jgi:hypothetical protein